MSADAAAVTASGTTALAPPATRTVRSAASARNADDAATRQLDPVTAAITWAAPGDGRCTTRNATAPAPARDESADQTDDDLLLAVWVARRAADMKRATAAGGALHRWTAQRSRRGLLGRRHRTRRNSYDARLRRTGRPGRSGTWQQRPHQQASRDGTGGDAAHL